MKKKTADMIIINARVYTVDNHFTIAEAFAVLDGKFDAVGTKKEILKKYNSEKIIDLGGKPVYPGFIDAHSHFYGYGVFAQRIDLTGTTSFEEMIELVKEWADRNPEGWIIGRGWDQNKWKNQEYPDNKLINAIFPSRPVMLTRVDGHAILVNNKALEISNLDLNQYKKFAIFKNNRFTGILLDNAADIVKDAANHPSNGEIINSLKIAQHECLKYGLTTVCDAGQSVKIVKIIDQLQYSGDLKIRIYAMLNPDEESIRFIEKNGIYKTSKLTVRAIKLYADGALGSRGACLLEPYTDMPDIMGTILYPHEFYVRFCSLAFKHNYQVCMHAIGDSANRYALSLYASFLSPANNLRWRIEHAQVVNEQDFDLFGKYSIIPSVQFVHAVSDMEWAEKRLGASRLKNAYAYRKLLAQNGWIPYGSDFPVESVNPLYGFLAGVFRKNTHGLPVNGFLPENAISREDALRSLTIWAARAGFGENETGSIEPGKFADFVVLDHDIMDVSENDIVNTLVLKTFIGGEEVYSGKN